MTPDATPLRKPPADPVAALADVLGRIERMEDGYHAAWIRPREDHRPLATAIVPALDAAGFALVPKVATADWTGSTRKDAEIARLRAALTRHHRTLHVTQEWCTDCKRAALAGGSDG